MRNAARRRPTFRRDFPVTFANPPSAELLNQFCKGEPAAAAALHERYVARLVALARSRLSDSLAARVDAEDVVQSAYRSFFVRARAGEFQLHASGDLWRLLARITLRKLYRQAEHHTAQRRSVAREQAASPNRSDDSDAFAASREPTPAEAAALADEIAHIMRRLNELQRQVLELRLQEHTIDEIAAHLGRSERTVRRTLATLRDAFAQE
jgi:RNA polymerase sigma factor (sigma-70 family)